MKTHVYHPEQGKGFVRFAQQLTSREIPLGYIRPPTVSPENSLLINQTATSDRKITLMGTYPVDAAGLVTAPGGLASTLPLVTAVFLANVPCFYRYRLRYPVALGPHANHWHPAAPVTIAGAECRMVAIPVANQTDLYYIDIYLTELVFGAYAVYTARIDTIDVADTREGLLPEPVSRTATLASVLAAADSEPLLAAEPISPTLTRVYVPITPKRDERERKNLTWQIEVMQGYTLVSTSSNRMATLLPYEQTTAVDSLTDGWLTVSAQPLTDLGITLAAGQYMRVKVSDPTIEVAYHPQGTDAVKLRWRSGKEPLDLPDRFTLASGYFTPQVAVGAADRDRPFVSVSGRALDEPWHVRVHLGRESQVIGGQTYLYALPEYGRDLFNPIPPYSRQEELPIRIGDRTFRVRRTPIDLGMPVQALIRGNIDIPITITEVDAEYGVLHTREAIPQGANFVVIYANRKDYVTYRGMTDQYLDLNPRHLSALPIGYGSETGSTKRLIDQTIYLYWLPYATVDATGNETLLRQETLQHSFAPLTDPTAIQLATIVPTLPFGPASIQVLDARRRGGGLPESVLITRERESDAASFADLGHFDGIAVPLAGSYVVEMAPWIPTQDPGQIRQIAEQTGPFGQLPLVTTVSWPEQILLPPIGLWVDIVEV